MRLQHAVLFVLLLAVPASAQEKLGTYEDRIAVEDVMARYVWSVDSLDADGYVAVFTPDAVIDSNGSLMKGHAEIRKVVTGLIQYQHVIAAQQQTGHAKPRSFASREHRDFFANVLITKQHRTRHR